MAAVPYVVAGLLLVAIVYQGFQRYRAFKTGALQLSPARWGTPWLGWVVFFASLAFVLIVRWLRHHPVGR